MHIHLACSFDCFLEYPSEDMMVREIQTSIVSYLCIEQHERFIEEVLEENDEINHYWAFHNIALDLSKQHLLYMWLILVEITEAFMYDKFLSQSNASDLAISGVKINILSLAFGIRHDS